MKNLDYYLDYDHSARRNTTLLSVAAGAVIGMFLEWVGVPSKIAAVCCVVTVGAIEVARAWRYVQPATKKQIITADSILHVRRSLILAPVSILLFVAMSFLPVSRIEAAVIERKLKDDAKDPFDEKSIQDTTRTLIHAQASNIKIKPSLISIAGEKFVDASEDTPEAWQTAQEFASYRSSQINPNLLPLVGALRRAANTALYHMVLPENFGEMWEAGNASPENAALIQPLDEPNPFEHEPGAQFIITDMRNKADFDLRPIHFKHFILKNATVRYSGGTVWLEDVYFVGCDFAFDQTPATRALIKQVITSTPINFKSL
jgi:hypothetical protein